MSILMRMFRKQKAPAVSSNTRAVEVQSGATPPIGDPRQALELAITYHNSGQLHEAQIIYMQVLAVDKNNFNALHLLGVLYHQRKEHARAAKLIEAALSLDSSNAAAHSNLGECYRAMGRNAEARGSYEIALSIQPDFADAAFNLGNLLQAEERPAEATACYETALRVQPAMLEARYQLGNALMAQRNFEKAKACFENVLNVNPCHAPCLVGLGNVKNYLGDTDGAEDCYYRALEANSALAPAAVNLGNVLFGKGRYTEAAGYFEDAANLDPESFQAWLGLGNACAQLNFPAKAQAHFEQALKLQPNSLVALRGLGNALADRGEQHAALEVFRKALSIDPENAEIRWICTIAQLPAIYDSAEASTAARNAFVSELQALDSWLNDARSLRAYEATCILAPFLLAYQDESNKELMACYGSMCVRLMRYWPGSEQNLPAKPRRSPSSNNDKIRVGFVSAHVYDHSVWNAIVKGFVTGLDRSVVNVQVFHLGGHRDAETDIAQSRADYFEQGTKPWTQWAETLSGRKLDVLIYPEVGMHAVTGKLASLRLAPVQVASWGHPETTGLPTMDHYLSADYLEPPNAQGHYTERLESLPNLGCMVEDFKTESVVPDFSALGVDGSVPVLLCPGVPFKYHPANDQVFVDIARKLKQCQFIFFIHRNANLSLKLKERLAARFVAAGLEPYRYLVFVPWQDNAVFRGLMTLSDVYLDTIGFSGFNTALQGLSSGLPIVTREGRFMRGRLGSGLLHRIGLSEFIAQSNSDYVEMAVKLASDKALRMATRDQIIARRSCLFNDEEPVRALEQFFRTAVAEKLS